MSHKKHGRSRVKRIRIWQGDKFMSLVKAKYETVTDFSDSCGHDRSLVYRWTHDVHAPNFSAARDVADALDMTLDELFDACYEDIR